MTPPSHSPALTTSEWTGGWIKRSDCEYEWDEGKIAEGFAILGQGGDSIQIEDPSDRHALAALCLLGQPYGFDNLDALGNPTSTFVEALRDVAETFEYANGSKMLGTVRVVGPAGSFVTAAHYGDMLRILADRIEALLPPPPQP